MKVDVDTKERMNVMFIFILQSYKVAMGSMLTLFVPQLCGEKVCGVTDNLYKEGTLHRAALSFNFISAFAFFVCYIIELKRENWCVEHLDIDDNFGDNNLPDVLKKRPDLELALHKINDSYFYSSQVTAVTYFINLIVSTVSIYHYTTGVTTITAYLSFVILILMKLKNAIYISRNSKRNNIALSAYMSELQSFNVVDKDHDLVGDGVSEVNVSEANVGDGEGEVDANSIEMTVQGIGGDGIGGDGIGGHGGIGADDKPIVANLTMI
tara:strand:- start:322 stop:1122 length:801 start_codon:yes stop_codon:yes gene_type:complete